MYFLGVDKAPTIKIMTLITHLQPKLRILSALGGYYVKLLVLWGHVFSPLSGNKRLFAFRRSEMLWQINVVCLFYRGSLYLEESVMGGSTVLNQLTCKGQD